MHLSVRQGNEKGLKPSKVIFTPPPLGSGRTWCTTLRTYFCPESWGPGVRSYHLHWEGELKTWCRALEDGSLHFVTCQTLLFPWSPQASWASYSSPEFKGQLFGGFWKERWNDVFCLMEEINSGVQVQIFPDYPSTGVKLCPERSCQGPDASASAHWLHLGKQPFQVAPFIECGAPPQDHLGAAWISWGTCLILWIVWLPSLSPLQFLFPNSQP